MRISAQNNQFIFQFPSDFVSSELEQKYNLLFDKNLIPYNSTIDYINSTIKEIVFPSLTFDISQQILKRGKRVAFKDAKNIFDSFTNEIDITFRSVDSHLNYFMLMELLIDFQLNVEEQYIPLFTLHILDKDGDMVYNIIFKEVLFKSLSETRLSYNATDFSEKTFSLTFQYNFIDINWVISETKPIVDKSVFDVNTPNINDRAINPTKK
jgi:hypothetical protein